MTKLRKQRRRKVFRHNVNRKRLRNKIHSVGKIECKEIKQAWEDEKSVQTNLKEMGLSYDPNATIKIPNSRKKFKASLTGNSDEWQEEKLEAVVLPKSRVVKMLEEDAKAPREKLFRLPKGQVEQLSKLIDKYGTDYRAMARDKENYNQETWKQIRAKIRRFKSIPEQYNAYLKSRGLDSDKFQEPEMSDDEI